MEYEDRITIAAPEGIELEYTLAGLGSRFIAAALDTLLRIVVLGAAIALAAVLGASSTAVIVMLSVGLFLALFAYPVAFEVWGGGRTPGKRWSGLRVLMATGQPVAFGASAVRTLLLIVDVRGTVMIAGAVSVISTKRNQRLGDLGSAASNPAACRRSGCSRRSSLPRFPVPPGRAALGFPAAITTVRPDHYREAELDTLSEKAGVPAAAPRRPIPPFTDEHEEFRTAVRRFARSELAPRAREWEEARWFPNEVFGRLAELGYIGLKFPPEYGGDGDPVADAVFVEELAWCGSGGLAAGIGAHSGIALPPIWKFGTEEQKQRYLVPGIRGERIAALAITEPDAGSDVASIRTHARKVDGGYVINGSKMFITGGVRADVLVTAVKTSAEGGHKGLSFLLIDRGPGVASSAIEKLGWHASDTAHIAFDDVFVPDENLLGQENAGFYLIMANFQWERLLMALGAVGAMRVAFGKTLAFARQRESFGRPIGRHQALRHKLAEIAMTIEAGRDVTYSALRRYVAGEDAVREVTIAKLATQRAAFDVMDTCLQIHGGAGYMVEYDIERSARDARLGPIGGGTDEIMKEILGRSLGL